MTKLRIHGFSVSLDGYAAGPGQDLDHPLGVGGTQLHEWVYPTRTFQAMFGSGDGTIGIDDDFAARGFEGIGAWILGRNMFGPLRGPWADDQWKGWWGDNPPYHTPVFVLTHHARPPLEMAGGTIFHFVTDGIHAALQRAQQAAGALDVRLGGGPATIRQYLEAGLHRHHAPGDFACSARKRRKSAGGPRSGAARVSLQRAHQQRSRHACRAHEILTAITSRLRSAALSVSHLTPQRRGPRHHLRLEPAGIVEARCVHRWKRSRRSRSPPV